jgi:protocatechuate 3,4-dioxygenase beta subunit
MSPTQRHGKLRGWAKSDHEGRYVLNTIRPGGYPFSRDPEHIHMHVIEPGRCTYYIDDIVFEDDKRLTDEQMRRMSRGRGGPGVANPELNATGSLVVRRDIVLGENIPGYPHRES